MIEVAGSTVLVDMDGVLANAHDGFEIKMAERFPHVVPRDSVRHFFPLEDYASEDHAVAWEILSGEGFFAELPLMANAIEGWGRLLRLGYAPRICSSPLEQNPTSHAEKLAWLERHFAPHFGMHIVDEAIITHDKAAFAGVALIDDKPKIRNSETAVWQHLLFDQPYNQTVETALRLRGWLDPELATLLRRVQTLGASSLAA